MTQYDREYLMEVASDKRIHYDLERCIKDQKKKILYNRFMGHELPAMSKIKKAELEEMTKDLVLNTEMLKIVVKSTSDLEYNFMKELIAREQIHEEHGVLEVMYLINMGLAYLYNVKGTLIYLMPQEIKTMLSSIMDEQIEALRAQWQLLDRFFRSVVEYYGVVTVAQAYELFQKYLPELQTEITNIEMFKEVAEELGLRRRIYSLEGNEIINSYFWEEDNKEVYDKVKTSKRTLYQPDRAEFLAYGDFLTKIYQSGYKELKAYIELRYEIDENRMEDLLLSLAYSAEFVSSDGMFGELIEKGVIDLEDEEEVRRYGELLVAVYNDTRMWCYGGHTPTEAGEQIDEIDFYEMGILGGEDEEDEFLDYMVKNRKNLNHILTERTVKNMRIIGKRYGIKLSSNLKKAQVVESLEEVLPDLYIESLKWMDEKQIEYLKVMINKDGVNTYNKIEDAYITRDDETLFGTHMISSVATFTMYERLMVLPDEIVAKLRQCDIDQHTSDAKRYSEWIQLMIGMTRLYGALKVSDARRILAKLTGDVISKETFHNVFESACSFYELDYMENDYIADVECYEFDEILEMSASRSDIDYKMYSKAAVLRYASDIEYVEETKAIRSFKTFLKNAYGADTETCNEVIVDIVENVRMGDELGEIIAFLGQMFEMPDPNVVNEVTSYVVKIYNSTGAWLLKGNAPNDLSARRTGAFNVVADGPQASAAKVDSDSADIIDFTTKKKIGRNDPCPCGSGRKYKHCCGK